VGQGVLRGRRKRLDQGCFGRGEVYGPVVDHINCANVCINYRHSDQRFDISGVECQGPLEKTASLRQIFGD
jgi:hypothetical protein